MLKESSGTLLYRQEAGEWRVLIVRPSGPSARYGWSIPKGLPDPNEPLEAAARRETREEAGAVGGELVYLGHVDYKKSRKRIHCFAGPWLEGEPTAASWEVDDARFLPLAQAREKLHPDQRAFIDRLAERLQPS